MECKYESVDTVAYLSLHDCECSRIYNENNNLVMLMEWMEVLETHPDNPYSEAHQSDNGMIELLECEVIHIEHNIGEEKILIESFNEIDFYEFEVLDFDIEKVKSNFQATIYMLKTSRQKQFENLLIELLFKKSRTRFNELNDVSWFVDFNNGKIERNSQIC